MKETNGDIQIFSTSPNRFYYLSLWINIASIGLFFFTDRYNTIYFLIVVLIADIFLLRDFFSHKYIRQVTINRHSGEIEFITPFSPKLEKRQLMYLKDVSISYQKEALGRLTVEKVIKFSDQNNKLIGKITPHFLFWKKKDIEKINKALEELPDVTE